MDRRGWKKKKINLLLRITVEACVSVERGGGGALNAVCLWLNSCCAFWMHHHKLRRGAEAASLCWGGTARSGEIFLNKHGRRGAVGEGGGVTGCCSLSDLRNRLCSKWVSRKPHLFDFPPCDVSTQPCDVLAKQMLRVRAGRQAGEGRWFSASILKVPRCALCRWFLIYNVHLSSLEAEKLWRNE